MTEFFPFHNNRRLSQVGADWSCIAWGSRSRVQEIAMGSIDSRGRMDGWMAIVYLHPLCHPRFLIVY